MTIEFMAAVLRVTHGCHELDRHAVLLWSQHGSDPHETLAALLADHTEAHQDVAAARLTNPSAYPAWPAAGVPEFVAHRMVALILDAGWTPPPPVEIRQAVEALPPHFRLGTSS